MQKVFRFIAWVTLLLVGPEGAFAAARPPPRSMPTFEGTAKIQVTHERIGTHALAYSVKGSKLRTELQISASSYAVAIVDLFNDEVLVLLPGQPLYVSMSLEGSAELALGHAIEEVVLEKTRERERILGYRCVKYIARHKNDLFEVWATEQLGSFMGLGRVLEGAKFQADWINTLVGKGFFPLRVRSLPGSETMLSMETLAVERGQMPDALFVPPEGFRQFHAGGIIQGLLGKH